MTWHCFNKLSFQHTLGYIKYTCTQDVPNGHYVILFSILNNKTDQNRKQNRQLLFRWPKY